MFSPENFGQQPRWLILDALKRGEKRVQQDLHLQELPVASMHHALRMVNGDDKTKMKDLCFFMDKDEDKGPQIEAAAANAYFSLRQEGKIGSWAIFMHKELLAARNDDPMPKLRALLGNGIVILAPKVRGDVLYCPVVLVQGQLSGQVVEVRDPDSPATYWVKVSALDTPGGGVTALGEEDLEILGKRA